LESRLFSQQNWASRKNCGVALRRSQKKVEMPELIGKRFFLFVNTFDQQQCSRASMPPWTGMQKVIPGCTTFNLKSTDGIACGPAFACSYRWDARPFLFPQLIPREIEFSPTIGRESTPFMVPPAMDILLSNQLIRHLLSHHLACRARTEATRNYAKDAYLAKDAWPVKKRRKSSAVDVGSCCSPQLES